MTPAAATRPSAAGPAAANVLLGVACASAKNCLAVGDAQNAFRGSGGPLAEKWNGGTWRAVPVRLPSGATEGGYLGSVSCWSAAHCVAVGSYGTSGDNHYALAETWNGTTWTPTEPPAPGGDNTYLSGVQCQSAKSCVAVGTYTVATDGGSTTAPLAETWNGRHWSEVRPPWTGAGALGGLRSLSCASEVSCVAGGLSDHPALMDSVLIESWNGKRWSMAKTPALTGNPFSSVSGVSCASADRCAAVGYTFTGSVLGSLAEMGNGGHWRLTPVPWPRTTSNPELFGVSCPAADHCVTVGTVDSNPADGINGGRAAAATWNGRAWKVQPVPAPGKREESQFLSVICLTATDCVAVGQLGPAGLTNGTGLSGFWNGKAWRLVAAK
jgi:hypothetical protein